MAKMHKLLQGMKSNPKGDWTPQQVRTLCKAYNLVVRQRGTSHAVITNALGEHLTIPMHKPIKPLYIKRLFQLLEANHEL